MTNEYRYFLESNLGEVKKLFVLFYSNQDDNVKIFKVQRYWLQNWLFVLVYSNQDDNAKRFKA